MIQRNVRRVPSSDGSRSPLIGAKEVASRLGVSERTVTRLFAARAIRAFRVEAGSGKARLWRTTEAAVEEYILQKLKHSQL